MTTEYTHEFHEQGNGFPCVGDDVIVHHDDSGHYGLARVASTSSIKTRQWKANWIYLTLEDSPTNWKELSAEAQDEMFDRLHHVAAITDDDSVDDINTDSDAYNTGYEAAKQGESRTDCPYAAGTWDAENWLAGYDAA